MHFANTAYENTAFANTAFANTRAAHRWPRLAPAFAALAALAVLFAAAPALAQDEFVAEIAATVDRLGYAIEDGASVEDAAIAALAEAGDGIGFVVLAADADGSPRAFAAEVLAATTDGSIHTIAVYAPNGFGAVSDEYFRADINRAVDDASAQSSAQPAFASFLGELTGVTVDAGAVPPEAEPTDGRVEAPTRDTSTPIDRPGETEADGAGGSGGGGVSIWPILLVIAVGVGGFVLWSKRKTTKQQHANLEQARTEAKAQMSAIAQMVYDLDARVTLSSDAELEASFAEASGDYQQLLEEIDDAGDGPQLAALSDRADHLRWQLEVIEAKLDGREPPKPTIRPLPRDQHLDDHDRIPADSRGRTRVRGNTCFFDPRHRSGVVPAAVTVGEDDMQVMICRDCSRRLREGERPEPGMVDVGPRRVPAAVAPVGYGGLGMALAKLFEVRTADMAQGVSFEWDGADGSTLTPGRRPRSEALPAKPRRRRRMRTR